jgi:Holliday junction resolvasome RuvABC ATP-dependent DNA helicase subunit
MTDLPESNPPIEARPSLSTFVGQEAIKQDLRVKIAAAKQNTTLLPHILFCGPKETGKSTLATAIAKEMAVNIDVVRIHDKSQINLNVRHEKPNITLLVRADVFEKGGDLSMLLCNLQEGELLVIEHIDLLKEWVLEGLLEAVEDFQIDVLIGQGRSARSIKLDLKGFTLVATTTRPSQVDKRLRRWMIAYDFAPYSEQEMSEIVCLLGKQQGLALDPRAADFLAGYCSGSPGDARVMVKRLRGFVSATGEGSVGVSVVRDALISFGYLDKISKAVDLAEKVRSMTALEFEEFVAALFRGKGYSVELTQRSGDHGIDLLMRKDRQLIVVQCKRWQAPVGESVVRDFVGSLVGLGAEIGYVVASSTFTSKAYSFAQGKAVRLIDLDALLEMAPQPSEDVG